MTLIECCFYTEHALITGTLETSFGRLADGLNDALSDYLELSAATIVTMGAGEPTAKSVMLPRTEVVLAYPTQKGLTSEVLSASRFRVAAQAAEVLLQAGQFTVRGTANLREGVTVFDHIFRGEHVFASLTRAAISEGSGGPPVQVPFVLVNRRHVQVVAEAPSPAILNYAQVV